MSDRLDAVFSPRSIAVIGASRSRKKLGWELVDNLLAFGFQGRVYPVNPKADAIHSIKAYPSVLDIPDAVDLAIIVVPAAAVPATVTECAKKGVRGLVVITAGFSEVGGEGVQREEALKTLVREHGMAMVGPNCMGVINTHPQVQMDATFAPVLPLGGDIAFMTQSGALGVAVLEHARNVGAGLSKFVSLGNAVDVSGNELLAYWERDPETHIVLLYIESFGDPREFVRLARRITKAKPILALKSGRTEAGARATLSHTGAMAGPDVGSEALLAQCGVLRVRSIQELFDLGTSFSMQPLPRGPRVAIVTNAGGPGIMATDALVSVGMEMAELAPETRKGLRKHLPPEASVQNPIDLIADAGADRYEAAMRAALEDDHVDALLVITVPPIVTDELAIAERIWRTSQEYDKTVVSTFLARTEKSPAVAELVAHEVPTYLFPENAARALAAMNTYRAYREREEGSVERFPVEERRVQDTIARAQKDGRSRLHEKEVLEVLQAYGLQTVETRFVESLEEALAAAQEIGYPVVLKAVHPEIVHKTEYNAVVLDLRNEEELRREFAALRKRLARRKREPREYMVQEFLRGGKETILGMKVDRKFGPLLLFGLGGIYVEVMNDVVFRLPPLTDQDALRMVQSIQSYPLLAGVRGEAPSDVPALVESLQRLSQLVEDVHQIEEIDVNPFLVFGKGEGCKVVDARVILTADSAS